MQVGSMNPQVIQQEILSDTTSFGAWAFLLDILFLFLIGIYVKKRMARKKEKKWVSSFDGKSELIMDLEPLPEPPMPPPPPTPQQMELLGILQDENLKVSEPPYVKHGKSRPSTRSLHNQTPIRWCCYIWNIKCNLNFYQPSKQRRSSFVCHWS